MPNPSFIYKNRYHTYYFRQKTPKNILQQLPSAKKEVKISLKTKEKSKALALARLHKTSFDMLFREITEGVMFIQSSKEAFLELSEADKRTELLKIRAEEAIQDQRYTQQLFFLFERKNRLKNLFNNFDDLRGCSLADVDLSSIDKINHFIAIADLLTDETLSDPSVYLEQIKWKPAPKQHVEKPEIKKVYKSIKLDRLVINRNKKQNKSINNPTELKRQSTSARRQVGTTLVGLLDSEISEKNHITAIRTQTDDIKAREDLVLEGISLDTEQDVVNFAKLMSLIEKGGDVQVSDFESFSKPVVVPKSMLKMSELFAKFYKERSAEWNSTKTHSTNKSIYNTFLEIIGDVFVDEFNGSYANQFVDTLQELPANRNKLKAYRDKSITDILALKGTFEAMKAANVNKYIERVSDVLEWAKSRHYISENLLKTMKIKDKNQKVKYKDERQRFNVDDLTQIFNSDKYLQGKLFCLNSNKSFSKLQKQKVDSETVSKALAHADKYKYRRYGFFGLKGCLTVWRMLKYMSKNIGNYEVTKPLKKLTDFALSNQFSKFLRTPEINTISIIYEEDDENNYVKKYSEKARKSLGFKLKGVSFYIKERYYSLYEKIIDLIRINIFLELTR